MKSLILCLLLIIAAAVNAQKKVPAGKQKHVSNLYAFKGVAPKVGVTLDMLDSYLAHKKGDTINIVMYSYRFTGVITTVENSLPGLLSVTAKSLKKDIIFSLSKGVRNKKVYYHGIIAGKKYADMLVMKKDLSGQYCWFKSKVADFLTE